MQFVFFANYYFVFGQTTQTEVIKLLANDGQVGDNFGRSSVSLSDKLALIGAINDDDKGSNSGSAYIFERNGNDNWSQVKKLTASDGEEGDEFGVSVSLFGNRALIGAQGDDEGKDFFKADSGSAYIFERDGADNWSQIKKLTPTDGQGSDRFGGSVSLDGNRALIGAALDDDKGVFSGSAYIFERDDSGNWTQVKKITASDGEKGDTFGESVCLLGNRALIGAGSDGDKGTFSGSAYIFERDDSGNWTQVKKLTANDGEEGDRFGIRVSLVGDMALLGASGEGDNGAAYIFERDDTGDWTQVKKLTASDGEEGDQFGSSVSLLGDIALVGASSNDNDDDFFGANAGAAYLFNKDSNSNWNEVKKFIASDREGNDQFGSSVSLLGDTALIGAYGAGDNGGFSGSAYIFDLDIGPVDNVDNIVPVITVNPVTVTLAKDSAAPNLLDGITATDNVDGNITNEIITTGSVDPSIPGDYPITYEVTDNAGNNAVAKNRIYTVTVNNSPTIDDISNVITLEDATMQTINLTGISAGMGENQNLTVTASSNNLELLSESYGKLHQSERYWKFDLCAYCEQKRHRNNHH